MASASQDSVLRIAMTLMIHTAYPHDTEVREAVQERLRSVEPLTPQDGQWLWPLVLQWASDRKPVCVEMLCAERERWEAHHVVSP